MSVNTLAVSKAILAIFLGLLLSGTTLAEQRKALLIGNDNYHSFTNLQNAGNDAAAMAKVLKELGFEVTLLNDATAISMDREVKRWTASLIDADIALFFYAGHGAQVEGLNYLVPVDFNGDELDAKHQCINANAVRERMESNGPHTNLIILDACRNNPFATTRGGSRGLAQMEGGAGTLIAFATSPGGTAKDNPGQGNGLFTKHLLANISTPGVEALQIFQNAGRGVYQESNGSQKPWISASVMPSPFFFKAGDPQVNGSLSNSQTEKSLIEERQRLKEERAQIAAERQRMATERRQNKIPVANSASKTPLGETSLPDYIRKTDPLVEEMQGNIQLFLSTISPLRNSKDIIGLKEAADDFTLIWEEMSAKLSDISPPRAAEKHYQALKQLIELQRESTAFMSDSLAHRITILREVEKMRENGASDEQVQTYVTANQIDRADLVEKTSAIKKGTEQADSVFKAEAERLGGQTN
jgi:Caspase domain